MFNKNEGTMCFDPRPADEIAVDVPMPTMDLSFNAHQGTMRPGTTCPVLYRYALPPTERADLTDEVEKKKKNGLLLDSNGTQMW